jgi:hypothetical protein
MFFLRHRNWGGIVSGKVARNHEVESSPSGSFRKLILLVVYWGPLGLYLNMAVC